MTHLSRNGFAPAEHYHTLATTVSRFWAGTIFHWAGYTWHWRIDIITKTNVDTVPIVYSIKYAHNFCLFSFVGVLLSDQLGYMRFTVIHMTYAPRSIRVASLALGQSYDCPSASEVSLQVVVQLNWHQTTIVHNQVWTMCIILGMYSQCTGLRVKKIDVLKN